jgi:general secretion pathway protein D
MKRIALLLVLLSLTACQVPGAKDERMAVSDGHVDTAVPPVAQVELDIPPVVEQVPIIAVPEPAEPMQTFTVVATDLPASELLFALARDARLNLDIDPAIDGRVSINAIDQTLPQILKRVSRQVALRYYLDGPNLVVELDKPFTRIYRVDYLNMSRETTSTIDVATQIASTGTVEGGGGGGGGSNSSASVQNEATNEFWVTIEKNLEAMASPGTVDGSVISNRESGTISVRTTAAAHEEIQGFIDVVLGSARRQVLIEATVVEVTLNDDFQAGVDWSRIAVGDGWSLSQNVLAETIGTAVSPVVSATYANSNSERDITAAVKALDAFGEVSVMSSPKIMALNNQTSILKVVDNIVYFTQDIDREAATDNSPSILTVENEINTVPVGFVMNVTPFITNDNEVILNIRPTISRILRFVSPPSFGVPGDPTVIPFSSVPEIQVREMESVLRVASGNTAVIGGLMQDSAAEDDSGTPGLHDAKGFGLLFGTKSRQYDKTELVIFLRPRVVDNASLDTNLQDFQKFLKPEIFSE